MANIHKYKFTTNKGWCGEEVNEKASGNFTKQWRNVTCKECLKFMNRYAKIKLGFNKFRKPKRLVPNMAELRAWWDARD